MRSIVSDPIYDSFVVFPVSKNVADKRHFPVEVDRRDQSIFVATNIEHVKVADLVGGVERAAPLVRYKKGFWIVSVP